MQFPSRFTVCAIVFVAIVGFSEAKDQNESSLWPIQRMLASKKFVDLTHEFAPGIPHWPGFPDETRKRLYWYDKRRDTMGAGFFSELFTHVGQWGTHIDPPAHFAKGLRTVDQIDPKEMILPMAVIDVHEDVAKNPDYTLALGRVKKWEADAHYPGWSLPALKFLYEQRKITASIDWETAIRQ